jgi:Secretory lipase
LISLAQQLDTTRFLARHFGVFHPEPCAGGERVADAKACHEVPEAPLPRRVEGDCDDQHVLRPVAGSRGLTRAGRLLNVNQATVRCGLARRVIARGLQGFGEVTSKSKVNVVNYKQQRYHTAEIVGFNHSIKTGQVEFMRLTSRVIFGGFFAAALGACVQAEDLYQAPLENADQVVEGSQERFTLKSLSASATTAKHPLASRDSFYALPSGLNLSTLSNGKVIKKRQFVLNGSIFFNVLRGAAAAATGLPSTLASAIQDPGWGSVTVNQLLYKSTDALGNPIANATTFIRGAQPDANCVVSYQSFYDSLDPKDSPSWIWKRAIDRMQGGETVPNPSKAAEILAAAVAYRFQSDCHVVMSDIEGPDASFGHGPLAGKLTLDSIRAILDKKNSGDATSVVGLDPQKAKVGMVGYSGGAIGTSWAAALADTYTPELRLSNRPVIVGASMGGVLINPANNFLYVNGSEKWGAVSLMALTGILRETNIELSSVFSADGMKLVDLVDDLNILEISAPELRNLRRSEFLAGVADDPATPLGAFRKYNEDRNWAAFDGVPAIKSLFQNLSLFRAPSPTMPINIIQGGSFKWGDWVGDDVMLATDARSLAKKYCAAGTSVFLELPVLNHELAGAKFFLESRTFLSMIFGNSRSVPSNCDLVNADWAPLNWNWLWYPDIWW